MTISSISNTYVAQQAYGIQKNNSSSGTQQSSSTTVSSAGDSVSISQAAYAALSAATQQSSSQSSTTSSIATSPKYQQQMAEITQGNHFLLANAQSNPTSPETAQLAYDMAHQNLTQTGGLVSLGATPDDPLTYTYGAPVTAESQAYYQQLATSFQNAASKLYDTAMAKGETPGQIVSQLYQLQAQQPATFRAMNMWPPAVS